MLQSKTASIPLKCRLQLYMINYYKSHKLQVWSCGMALLSLLYIFSTLRQRSKTVKKIEELVQAVLQILAEQDALNRRDPTIPSSISIHQIRDALFFKTSNRTRHRLWPLLCKAIERNSNVRESVMNIKGEQHRVWEWIGSDVLSPLIVKSL